MIQKTNAALLIIALLFISGCGERLTDYQIEIIEKSASIIALDDVSELSPRDVYVLLGLLYTECVKLKEYKEVGSNYDTLYTAFSNLIPTYQKLVAREEKKGVDMQVDVLSKMAKVIANDSDEEIDEYIKELEGKRQAAINYLSKIRNDQQELFNSLLRITTQTQENPIWAKTKAKDYLREFHNFIEPEETVREESQSRDE